MSHHKNFYIIAYDIADDKRRSKVVKSLERVGTRINFSVFECMLSQSQLDEMITVILNVMKRAEDKVVVYPICRRCFTKIKYYPPNIERKSEGPIAVVGV